MFFGVEVKSNQNQAKPMTLTNTVKLGQAVLDPRSKSTTKDPVSLVAEYKGKQFILCVLDPTQSWQCPLDLIFEGGSELKFFVRGSGTVHLTGYEQFDDLDNISMSMSSDDEVEEVPTKSKVRTASAKKALNDSKTNGVKGSGKKNGLSKKDEDTSDDDDDEDYDGALFNTSDDDGDDDDDDDDDDDVAKMFEGSSDSDAEMEDSDDGEIDDEEEDEDDD